MDLLTCSSSNRAAASPVGKRPLDLACGPQAGSISEQMLVRIVLFGVNIPVIHPGILSAPNVPPHKVTHRPYISRSKRLRCINMDLCAERELRREAEHRKRE